MRLISHFIFWPLLLLLAACNAEDANKPLLGYVEGRQVILAPRATGIITKLQVAEGDQVAVGAVLFSVDSARAQADLDGAIAARSAAEARLQNLKKGGRPEEIRATTETLKQSQAALTLAEQTYSRSKDLVRTGVIAAAKLDQDRATRDAAQARVTEARSRLDLMRLPARADLINAAAHDIEVLNTAVSRAQIEVIDRHVTAPAAGRIETIYRRVGEIAGPSQPVLALLPPDQKRIRFFVPEPLLPRIRPGGVVTIDCDNCGSGQQGKITFIAHESEFTPPIIFTETERAKLVYMIEAKPDHPDQFLTGQPVSVTLP